MYGCFSDGWTIFTADFRVKPQKGLNPGVKVFGRTCRFHNQLRSPSCSSSLAQHGTPGAKTKVGIPSLMVEEELRGSTQVHELVPCVHGLGSFFRVVGSNPTVDRFFNFTFGASVAG